MKVLRTADDPVAVSRFGREGAVLLRLRHPSIVRLYAFYPSGPAIKDPTKINPAALVMEHVPGETLDTLVAADGYLSPARTVQIIGEVAAGLDCVHALGVVHRDIKPASILLPRRGPAKLTDFGVAHLDNDLPLTVMGDILGAIEYASPEQVHGSGAADARSDVYSLAAVTYFALTGTPPFRAADTSTQSQLSVMHRQIFSNPPPLRLHRSDLSPAIEDAVLRGLAKEPEARYASAGQLAAVLRAALAASEGEPQQKAMEAISRRTGIIAGAAAGAVLLAGLTFWIASHRPKASVPAPVVVSALPNYGISALPKNGGVTKPKKIASAAAGSILKKAPVKQVSVKQVSVKQVSVKQALVKQALVKQAPVKAVPARTAKAPVKTAQANAGQETVRALHLPKPRPLQPESAKTPLQKPLPQMLPRVAAAVPVHRLPSSAKAKTAALIPAAATRAGWYAVSGWTALPGQSTQNQPGQKTQLVRASPAWVNVDGHPLPQLAAGEWIILPVGTHRVTFQPAAGLGAGPKTWTVKISPSAHLSQQVPLPPAPLPDIPTHLRNP